MHHSQVLWCQKIKKDCPDYFKNKRILEVGSLRVNGTNRSLFENCQYIGIDVVPGECVDVVSVAHKYKPEELFDVVISTNSLEHDMFFDKTLRMMVDVLKPEGLLMFSAASHGQGEHGTVNRKPHGSGTSQLKGEWSTYYKNLYIRDITDNLELEALFKEFYLGIAEATPKSKKRGKAGNDLRFWGIKKGIS